MPTHSNPRQIVCRTNLRHIISNLYFGTKPHSCYPMRAIGLPLSSLKSHKEVAELLAADSTEQRPSKLGIQTYRGRPANLTCSASTYLLWFKFLYNLKVGAYWSVRYRAMQMTAESARSINIDRALCLVIKRALSSNGKQIFTTGKTPSMRFCMPKWAWPTWHLK